MGQRMCMIGAAAQPFFLCGRTLIYVELSLTYSTSTLILYMLSLVNKIY